MRAHLSPRPAPINVDVGATKSWKHMRDSEEIGGEEEERGGG